MRIPKLLAAALAFGAPLVLSAVPAFAATYSKGQSVTVDQPVAGDAFYANQSLSVEKPIAGELFAAGSSISVKEMPLRSAFLAGNQVNLENGVGYDLFAAGSDITLSGTYGHDVYVAGSTVHLTSGSVIKGDLWVAGGDVRIEGAVNGSVHDSGQTLDVTGAHIAGDLNYYSNNDVIGASATTVAGQVSKHAKMSVPKPTDRDRAFGWLTALFATVLAGAILISIAPAFVLKVEEQFSQRWVSDLGRGAAVLILGPTLAILATITLIGWKVAIILMLAWGLMLMLTGILSAFVLGNLILRQTKSNGQWLALILGAFILEAAHAVPGIGGLLGSVLFVFVFVPTLGSLYRTITSMEKLKN